MRRVFWIAGFLLLTALLLLPLVEKAPEGETALPEPPIAHAAFLPAALPAPESPAAPRQEAARGAGPMLAAMLLLFVPLPVLGSDRNGRVVRKRRYARGYYLLFRQEAACG
ncbi:MAG: hypothetical protein PHY12_10780 [Eubacteriales bacterium]|nr:hypothetical protein [Eubacteriales bacterium]